MTTKHTPGPWGWDSTVWDYDPVQEAPWLVTTEGDRVLSGSIQCTSKANARLIAAAPVMYDYIEARAKAGDSDAQNILGVIHASR